MSIVSAQRNRDPIASVIVQNFSRILGLPDGELVQLDDSLLDMGADSLALMKCIDFLQDDLGVSVAMSQFYQDFATLGDVVQYVLGTVSREVHDPSKAAAAARPLQPAVNAERLGEAPAGPQASVSAGPSANENEWVRSLLASHVALMDRQLQVLDRLSQRGTERAPPSAAIKVGAPAVPAPRPQAKAAPDDGAATDRFNVFAPRARAGRGGLTETQSRYLESFVQAYARKHAGSKRLTQQARRSLADNRVSAGFKPNTKEILFPIVAERAEGASIWDVDGNRFVDITMGFGVHLFGHNPAFIRDPIIAQARTGFPIGPQSPLAGRVADLICELTGHERVVFCNSGTEATMTALRIARAHTGRTKIVIFRESYHGTFDSFLARPDAAHAGAPGSVPVSAGVTPGAIAETIVLDYGDPHALELVEELGPELAAVVVEPVQSRRPWLQPREFLARLREITRDHGVVFIWDEVITGFRVAAGGAQEHFGIRADLATYGKIAGGGLPIGMVAGGAALLDRIDGGYWQYGDDSFPAAEQIFFAGTFTKHPLAMAAAVAVLEKLRGEKSALYPALNARTQKLALDSNKLFDEAGIAIRVECFGSLFRYVSRKNIDMFFNHLMMEGVFIWEGRNCFLSTAHTDDDIDFVLQATGNAIRKLQAGGFFEDKPQAAAGRPVAVWARRFTRLWTSAPLALNIGGGVLMRGVDETHVARLAASVETVLGGCAGINAHYDAAHQQWCASDQRFVAARVVEPEPGRSLEELAGRMVDAELGQPFRPEDSAQMRAKLVCFGESAALLILVANHAVCDGYSFALALDAIFSQAGQPSPVCPFTGDLGGSAAADARYRQSPNFARDHDFWMQRVAQSYGGATFASAEPAGGPARRVQLRVDAAAVTRLAKKHRVTSFAVLVTAFQLALWDDAGLSARGTLGVPFANRAVLEHDRHVVQVSNILPLAVKPQHADAKDLAQYVGQTAAALRDLAVHGAYPVFDGPRSIAGAPPIVLSVNLEAEFDLACYGVDAQPLFGKRHAVEFPIEVNILKQDACYDILCDYQERTIREPDVLFLTSRFEQLLTIWSQNAS